MSTTTRTPTRGFRVVVTHDADGNRIPVPVEVAFVLNERHAADIVADYRTRFPRGWAKYEDAARAI